MAGGLLGPSLGMRGIFIAAALCYGVLSLVLGRQFTHTRTGGAQELTLTRQGRSVKLLALRDTGNTLQDPPHRPARGGGGGGRSSAPSCRNCPGWTGRAWPTRWSSSGTWRGRRGTCGSSSCPIGRWGVECGLLLALRVDRANCGGREVRTALPPLPHPAVGRRGGTAPSSAARGVNTQ